MHDCIIDTNSRGMQKLTDFGVSRENCLQTPRFDNSQDSDPDAGFDIHVEIDSKMEPSDLNEYQNGNKKHGN